MKKFSMTSDSNGTRLNVLEAPCSFHPRHANADDTDSHNDPAHPYVRTELGHDEVGGEIEDDIADIEQSQAGRHLLRSDVEDRGQIMVVGLIHCLGKPDVGTNGGAEEIQSPES